MAFRSAALQTSASLGWRRARAFGVERPTPAAEDASRTLPLACGVKGGIQSRRLIRAGHGPPT
jgi:hypothetical protein